MLTKRECLRVFRTQAALGRVLGIGRAAVSLWPDDEPIPILRELQLRTLYQKEFGPPSEALTAFQHPLRRRTDKPTSQHPLRRHTDKPRKRKEKVYG
jgi:hypothetical protein